MIKKILDVTCGSRTIWFNKNHPAAFPIAELVKPENRMAPTENYRITQHGMCRWMKHANGNYVLVQNESLSCFTGAEFYSEGYNISMIVAAEGDIPVGIILPIRSSYVPDAELLEPEG